jgi:hypothetical protein
MTDEPKDIDRPKRKVEPRPKPRDREPPSKRPDRSGHLGWGTNDVEHHGIEPSEGSQRQKSFKTWKRDGF